MSRPRRSTWSLGQDAAYRALIRWRAPKWMLLHGPPGTGKTTILAALARRMLAGGGDRWEERNGRRTPVRRAVHGVEYHSLDEVVARERTKDAGLDKAPMRDVARVGVSARMDGEHLVPCYDRSAVLLLDELADEEVDEADLEAIRVDLTRIRSASGHLLNLINDILDLAKIEAGQLTVRRESVALAPLVAEVLAEVEPAARAKGLAVVVDVPPDLGELTTDPRRLRQVLLNLLSNAVKFTEAGEVRVTAWRGPGLRAIFRVSDTGIGISPEALPRVFRPFYQADDSATRKHGGTGLGLAIVNDLVRLLGGTADAASVLGEGSVFTVSIVDLREEVVRAWTTSTTDTAPDLFSGPRQTVTAQHPATVAE